MKLSNENKNLKSATRRNFLKLAGSGSFTAAMVAGAAGTLWSTEAAAQTASEERDREKAADHVMTIATAYVLGATRSYPIMQLDLKENIQNATSGKVYVKLAPGGQLGAGGALAQKVQSGTIQAAQHSLSNFAPFASTVDLINMYVATPLPTYSLPFFAVMGYVSPSCHSQLARTAARGYCADRGREQWEHVRAGEHAFCDAAAARLCI